MGTAVDVGRTVVGVGVLVAGISSGVSAGMAVGVVVGSPSHADSNAAASKHSSPTHAIRRTGSLITPTTGEVIEYLLFTLLGIVFSIVLGRTHVHRQVQGTGIRRPAPGR